MRRRCRSGALAGHISTFWRRNAIATSSTAHVTSETRICAIESWKSNAVALHRHDHAREMERGSRRVGSSTGYEVPRIRTAGLPGAAIAGALIGDRWYARAWHQPSQCAQKSSNAAGSDAAARAPRARALLEPEEEHLVEVEPPAVPLPTPGRGGRPRSSLASTSRSRDVYVPPVSFGSRARKRKICSRPR